MSDNLLRYRAIQDAMRQWYPASLNGYPARHLITLAMRMSGIVGSQHTHLDKIAAQVPTAANPHQPHPELCALGRPCGDHSDGVFYALRHDAPGKPGPLPAGAGVRWQCGRTGLCGADGQYGLSCAGAAGGVDCGPRQQKGISPKRCIWSCSRTLCHRSRRRSRPCCWVRGKFDGLQFP